MQPWSRNTHGNGKEGGGAWRGESQGDEARKPCRFFQRGQTCRYGSSCRFAHAVSTADRDERAGQHRRTAAEPTPERQQAGAAYASWRRILKRAPDGSGAETAEALWEGALKILDGGDRDLKHAVARDLDDEALHGRRRVLETIAGAARPGRTAHNHRAVSLFLRTVTHTAMLDCLSVDTCVGGLYSFLSGTNGSRGIPALQRFCDDVRRRLRGGEENQRADVEAAAVALSTALREVLKREQRARLNDDLPRLVDSVEALAGMFARRGVIVTSAQLLHHVGEIRAVMSRARGLLQAEEEADGAEFAEAKSIYPRGVQLPGGRHDNDSADIAAVQIFPTRAEMLSDAVEFLLSTDPEQPYFLADKA